MANHTSLPRKMRDLKEESNTGEFHLNSNFQSVSRPSFYMKDSEIFQSVLLFHIHYWFTYNVGMSNHTNIRYKLHNQRTIIAITHLSFSSWELLEDVVTTQICSYCCIIFTWLFTINHIVYAVSSSVSQCTSCVQSNTTSDWVNAPFFSHFI